MDTVDSKNAASFKTGSQVQKGGANSSKRCRALLKDMERQMILDSMVRNQQYKAAVARELGIPLSTLKRRLKEYQIGDED